MKKFLLTATMLVAFTALSQAQQGRVGINTTTPAATLDVVASTDATRPDALLVPRLSRADLEARTTAYANGNATAASAQNGALVFVNALGGAGTGKTVNVTATGFYYYDGTNGNNVWKPLGGSSAPAPLRINLAQAAATNYDWSNSNFDVWEFTSGTQLTLPTPASYINRTIYIRAQVGGSLQFAGTDGVGTPKGLTAISAQGAVGIFSNGTTWYLISGRN